MNRIRELRKQNKMSMKELAKKLNRSESMISLYETGKTEPDIETLIIISEIFDVSLDYISGKEVKEQQKPLSMTDKIIQLRVERGMTAYEFSKRLDMDYSNYMRYQKGTKTPSTALLCEMAKVLGVDATVLLSLRPEVTNSTVQDNETDLQKEIYEKLKLLTDTQLIELRGYLAGKYGI